jgi:alginate O-acetyltransferase complex protein AlgI
MFAGMAGRHGLGALRPDIVAVVDTLWIASLYAIVWLAPSTRQWMQADPTRRFAWSPSPRWAVVMGCAASLGLLAAGGTGEFLYFKF